MSWLKRDIPVRGALAALAVVAVASVIGSRDQPAGATALPRAPQAGSPQPAQAAPRLGQEESLSDVDVTRLKRERWSEGVANLLAPHTVAVTTPQATGQPASAVAPAATPPAAPPLPFVYLGKIIDGGKTMVFVGRDADHYSVEAGGEIDQYKVERVSEKQITFLYRPLGIRQVLEVPQPGEERATR